jgi:hypothetical protein
MTDHHHPTTPAIPTPANRPLTTCSPLIERRIRQTLAWNAGDCGLIRDDAVVIIGTMYLENLVTIGDIRKLAKPLVYAVILQWIADERDRRSAIKRRVAAGH